MSYSSIRASEDNVLDDDAPDRFRLRVKLARALEDLRFCDEPIPDHVLTGGALFHIALPCFAPARSSGAPERALAASDLEDDAPVDCFILREELLSLSDDFRLGEKASPIPRPSLETVFGVCQVAFACPFDGSSLGAERELAEPFLLLKPRFNSEFLDLRLPDDIFQALAVLPMLKLQLDRLSLER